jgi:hypothetical protein
MFSLTLKNPPKSLKKLNELVLCSNLIIGGGYPFAVGNILPLIIGGGEKPQIWLQAINDSSGKNFIPIVENSISRDQRISVYEDPVSGEMKIFFYSTPILIVKLINKSKAEISLLDLRPFGLNVWGNTSALYIGGSRFSHNRVHGVGVFINLG